MQNISRSRPCFSVMKFGKKLKDLSNAKLLEPQVITGINRLVCTSKAQNVELKGKKSFE